jgi:hypothetical protein
VCVCGVCDLFVDLFQDDLRCLFSPHQVNLSKVCRSVQSEMRDLCEVGVNKHTDQTSINGGVQKIPTQVSLYKCHTTEESLRRLRSGRYCQVQSNHSDQVGKLLLVLLPPHQRVCVVGHLLDLYVDLKLGFPSLHQRSIATCLFLTPHTG